MYLAVIYFGYCNGVLHKIINTIILRYLQYSGAREITNIFLMHL